jgi:hypothetical protein
MCHSNACKSEFPSGKCGHKASDGPFPCNFDTTEEAEQAQKDFDDERDIIMDHKYEEQKDRQMGI